MKLKFLCDADFTKGIVEGLCAWDPRMDIRSADDAGLRGIPDSKVLSLAAEQGRVLRTRDRRTMPHHFAHFIQKRDSAGVIIVAQNVAIRSAIEEIYLIWAVEDSNAWTNRISDVPV